MSLFTTLGFVVLLLPAILAFFIPASPRASPDPWKVKRIRRSLVTFSLFVAAINFAYYRFQIFLWRESSSPPRFEADGAYIWAVMAWFFLGALVVELRRPKRDPFPGQVRRSAVLSPRHLKPPVPRSAWWLLGLSWSAASAGVVLALPTVPAVSWVLLASALVFIPLGPRLVRNDLLTGEPLPEMFSAELREAYARRRRMRSWSIFLLVAFAVFLNVGAAWMTGRAGYQHFMPPALMTAAAALVLFMVAYGALEAVALRRISAAAESPRVAEGS